jgi:hypothetical protein
VDPIVYWNAVALDTNRESHTNGSNEQTGPVLSARALAIVHLAMHDAFAGIAQRPDVIPPYLAGLPAPDAGAGLDAAVAAAAHHSLVHLFPAQRETLNVRLAVSLLPEAGKREGTEYGRLVAEAILDDRGGDPGASDAGYVAPVHAGAHQPDPDNSAVSFHAPFYGAESTCFAVSRRHELQPPPALGTGAYVSALNELRGKGIAPHLMGTVPAGTATRTPTESVIGLFWGYDGARNLGTPPRLYNQIVREVARAQANAPADNARLFALVNVAMADAAILAWDQKYLHNLWRPVVGIRNHDSSMGPLAVAGNAIDAACDPGWLPFGAPDSNAAHAQKNFTPQFPAYPSGHATFGAAALHMTRLFYGIAPGDRSPDALFNGLSFVSDELNGVTTDNNGTVRPRHVRNFPGGLWQMIEENGRSRVYLGVHWIFDAFAVGPGNEPDLTQQIGGVPLGLRIAEDIFNGGRASGLRKSAVGPRP